MSEKAVEVVQALLQELIEIVATKPALAKQLVDAIEFRLVASPFDPLVVYQREGRSVLQSKLSKLPAETLRILVRQNGIPCQNASKRKKPELVQVVVEYAANTDIGSQAEAAE